ncbi:MAG TPA: O-antigen ligase family protein [Bryobacteraceae bacterium]|nr:O-antigen ligase family protein [Bryobacteraceae bacterium]
MIARAARDTRWAAAAIVGYATLLGVVPNTNVRLLLAGLLVTAAALLFLLSSGSRWIPVFFATALLLPPLPLAFGDSGPHVCILLAAVGLLVGFLCPGKWKLRMDFLGSATILLFAALAVSIPVAAWFSGVNIAVGTAARVLLFGISVYLLFYTAYGPASADCSRLLFGLAVASAAFACVDFYFQFPAPAGFGPQFVWLDSGVYRRAQGIFYEASTLGNFCAFFLVMIAVILSRPKAERRIARTALIVGGAVLGMALVLSYSRASILTVLVAVAVLRARSRRKLRWKPVFAGAAIALAVGLIIFPTFVQLSWDRAYASLVYFRTYPEAVLSGRLSNWQALGEYVVHNPQNLLLGIGYKTLPYTNITGNPIVADNMYLSMLVETGLVGLAALLLFHAAVLRTGLRAARSSNPRAVFFGLWIFCFWVGQILQMFSGDLLTYWRVLPVYFWVLGMAERTSHEDPVPRSI